MKGGIEGEEDGGGGMGRRWKEEGLTLKVRQMEEGLWNEWEDGGKRKV